MARRLRVAYGRIAHETHAFSPIPTTLADFERLHHPDVVQGPELARRASLLGAEMKGLIRNAEVSGFALAGQRRRGVEMVPLISAWAIPSGPLSEEAYEGLKRRLVSSLERAGSVDAVCLSMHGAMRGPGPEGEPEAGFLRAVREVVGRVPLAVTLDLHGLLTPEKVGLADVIVGYRTNPHRDLFRAGRRAGDLAIRAARGEIRPTAAWRSLPMLLGGGRTIDLLPPVRRIFRRMSAMERRPGVLSASLFMCHLWNDSPDLGWSTYVVTDDDQALAESLADELAEMAWSVRDQMPPAFDSPEAAIAKARAAVWARRTGVVMMTDTSDVCGAGAPGENTHLLRALLDKAPDLLCYVPLRDNRAVDALWSEPEGARIDLSVGGHLGDEISPALPISGRVLEKADTGAFGRCVTLAVGHVRLALTDQPPYTVKPSFWSQLGLDPWRADVLVVKSFFHFRIYHAAIARKHLLVKTRGLTDFDVAWRGRTLNDPVHPRDEVPDWRPADRRRRGVV